jgi:hypothetical protein
LPAIYSEIASSGYGAETDPSKDLFWTLRLLRDHRITIEGEGYWNFRVSVSESPAPELTLSPLNPVFPEIPKKFAKTNIEAVTRLL